MAHEDVRAGRFAGRVAMVTGAASGMGAAVARQLAAEGARAVVLADVNGDGASAVAEELPAARAVALDVTDAAGVGGAFRDVLRRHGRLDVLVHAAGIDDPEAERRIAEATVEGRPVELADTLDDASWRRVMGVNLDGTFRGAARQRRPVHRLTGCPERPRCGSCPPGVSLPTVLN